jgi:hypothetical protein
VMFKNQPPVPVLSSQASKMVLPFCSPVHTGRPRTRFEPEAYARQPLRLPGKEFLTAGSLISLVQLGALSIRLVLPNAYGVVPPVAAPDEDA